MKTYFYSTVFLFAILVMAAQSPAYGRITSVNANFLLSAGPNICPGKQISFNNISFGATRFMWKINGVIFSEAIDTSYVFIHSGIFDITLIASDSACSDSLTRQLTVASRPVTVYNIVPQTCPGDMNGMIDLTLSGGFPPFVIGWTTGDTTEDIAGLDSGSYILTLRDSAGCVQRDTVRVPSLGGVNANFQVQVLNAFVRLTDLSDTTAIQWEWNMGDGTPYSQQNPTHTYSANGQYDLCLTVTDSAGCRDTLCETISVVSTRINGPIAEGLTVHYDPASESIQVTFSQAVPQKGKATVIDLQGQKVREHWVKAGATGIQLGLNDLPAGIYYVKVDFSEKSYVVRVMKGY
ncbi:PKD domain-containing protein [bacterium]|nr:PKD domain-containing protein [bacterium]